MVRRGLLVFLTWLFLERRAYGAIMRAGMRNKEMCLLIDINLLFTVAFALGPTSPHRGRADGADSGTVARMGVTLLGIAFVVGRARRPLEPARRDRRGPS